MRGWLALAVVALLAACEMGSDQAAGNTGAVTAEAQGWLDEQNAVRKNPQPPPPAPLPPLTWSDAAASVAQAWANGCNYAHNPGRGERGENIAASSPPGNWTLSSAVSAWAGEAPDYDYAHNSCAPGKQCGHYTQLVWRDTLRVGCAHKLCTMNSPFGAQFPSWDFWVCDYEPPGNVVGQRPY